MSALRSLKFRGEREKQFGRFFASQQMRLDVGFTFLGSLVYLSLMRPLWELGRLDLMAAACACAVICLWPFWLTRWAKNFYMSNRDLLFVANFAFHHLVGAQLARFVRLQSKFDSRRAGVLFVAVHFMSSSVMWQGIDALMYRIRLRHFLWSQPIKLLASLSLELQLCKDTCAAYPEQSRAFVGLVEAARVVLSMPLALPGHLAANAALTTPLASCLKMQTFLLAALAYVVPAGLLFLLEQDSRRKFLQLQGLASQPQPQLPPQRSSAPNAAAACGAGGVAGAAAGGAGGGRAASDVALELVNLEEEQRSQRRYVVAMLFFAVPAIWTAVDTVLE